MVDGSGVEVHENSPAVEYENHVLQAGKMIGEARYQDAIESLRDREEAQKAGVKIEPGPVLLIKETPREEVLGKFAASIADGSHFIPRSKTIKLANPFVMPGRLAEIPESLLHDTALIHLEEWLHGFQDLRGKSLTGEEDYEVDVVLYMAAHNIPLTDNFLDRYGRHEAVTKAQELKSKVIQFPRKAQIKDDNGEID